MPKTFNSSYVSNLLLENLLMLSYVMLILSMHQNTKFILQHQVCILILRLFVLKDQVSIIVIYLHNNTNCVLNLRYMGQSIQEWTR